MSEVFTNNTSEQALLQGPKSLEFVKTLHHFYLIQSNHIFSPEVLLKIVTRTNSKKIIYVLMVISAMTTMMIMKTLVMHHYFHQ